MYLREVAVGVGGECNGKVTHLSADAELRQLDGLALKAALSHRDQKVDIEISDHLCWLRDWLADIGTSLILEITVGDL